MPSAFDWVLSAHTPFTLKRPYTGLKNHLTLSQSPRHSETCFFEKATQRAFWEDTKALLQYLEETSYKKVSPLIS